MKHAPFPSSTLRAALGVLICTTTIYLPVFGQPSSPPGPDASPRQVSQQAPATASAPGSNAAPDPGEEPAPPPAVLSRRGVVKLSSSQASPHSHLEDLGDLFVVKRRYLDAVNAYEQTAGSSPVVWNKLGIAYQHLFDVKAAQASYEHALALDPKYAEAINNLGTILYSQKNYRGAEKSYVRALKLSPQSAVIYANLGTARFARGDYKRGIKSYREAFRLDPTVFDAESANKIQEVGSREARAMLNFNLAKFYAGAGLNTRALVCLRQALDDGFRDRKKLMEDEELAELRTTQEFRELLNQQRMH